MVKNLPANAGGARDTGLVLSQEDPTEEKLQPTLVFLTGKSHGLSWLQSTGLQSVGHD